VKYLSKAKPCYIHETPAYGTRRCLVLISYNKSGVRATQDALNMLICTYS